MQALADSAMHVAGQTLRKQYIDGIVLTKFDTVDDKVRARPRGGFSSARAAAGPLFLAPIVLAVVWCDGAIVRILPSPSPSITPFSPSRAVRSTCTPCQVASQFISQTGG